MWIDTISAYTTKVAVKNSYSQPAKDHSTSSFAFKVQNEGMMINNYLYITFLKYYILFFLV